MLEAASLETVAVVESGEEVIIARGEKPEVKLVIVPQARKPRRELLGAWEGLFTLPTDEEWKAMDSEIESNFDKPLLDRPESD